MNDVARTFMTFATERHTIYVRRSRGDVAPWTDDPILQNYHFCNVFRELDRTTAWLDAHWYARHPNDVGLWFAASLARRINWPPTLAVIGYPLYWRPEMVLRVLRDRMASCVKTFSPAYRLFQGKEATGDSLTHCVRRLLQPLYDARTEWQETGFGTLAATAAWFNKFPGWGPFTSYQVVLDLTLTRYLCGAPDRSTWGAVGPGSRRGLNRVAGRLLEAPLLDATALDEMRWLVDAQRWLGWPREYPQLRVSDVEHALCEFDKYERIRVKDGVLRRFRPTI